MLIGGLENENNPDPCVHIGGCGCYTGSITFISHLTNKHERPLYLSGVLIVWGIGSVVGPLVGGGFAQSSAGWRWAFYINLIIAAISAPGLIWCLPNLNPADMPFTKKLQTQDWAGITVFSGLSVCFTMALAFGGTIYSFGSAQGIVLWVMTGVLIIAMGLVTYYHPFIDAKDRLYPVHLFKYVELSLLKLELFMAMGCMMTALYYIPLLFQFSRGDTPLEAGVRLLPFMCCLIAMEVINGWLMPKFGYYMPWYIFGNVLILAGGAAMRKSSLRIFFSLVLKTSSPHISRNSSDISADMTPGNSQT
jgi:MFS family permease